MIEKVIVRNFKKFGSAEFDLPNRVVIVGPNNSGKTTLLQAIAAWSELAFQWRERYPDLVREPDGNYPCTDLNLLRFHSVPLADFNHLWRGKNVDEPVSIRLRTGAPNNWRIGFEVLYSHPELARIRPMRDIKEDHLDAYLAEPLIPTYIPPASGVDIREPGYGHEYIPAQLARAQGGRVLRNLLLVVRRDADKWSALQHEIKAFFGYELDPPSAAPEILARYRHKKEGQPYDLSSAASGFLQVLMVYAALLHKESSVVLLDEPDAHLHALLEGRMYEGLCKFAAKHDSQLIISTHSERLIDAVRAETLRVLGQGLHPIRSKGALRGALRLENSEIVLAHTKPKILYVEGSTDVPILREWARVLNHRALSFLEAPFFRETASERQRTVKHFAGMKLLVPMLRGLELRDRDNKERTSTSNLPVGLKRCYWERYEIESYLINPRVIVRYAKKYLAQSWATRVEDYMKRNLPPALYEDPFELSDYLRGTKAKSVLAHIFETGGMNVDDVSYDQIAAEMSKEEIHPEVVEKLDAIADHLDL